ncbi:hypothetical protein GCM10022207_82210 [Streptomyces lannensis]|uniref:Uncharacterized protein n=1 Tax=Streptomyces lannensis TaxID=766498 RepID=A0ABP7LJN5_9ACTN
MRKGAASPLRELLAYANPYANSGVLPARYNFLCSIKCPRTARARAASLAGPPPCLRQRRPRQAARCVHAGGAREGPAGSSLPERHRWAVYMAGAGPSAAMP